MYASRDLCHNCSPRLISIFIQSWQWVTWGEMRGCRPLKVLCILLGACYLQWNIWVPRVFLETRSQAELEVSTSWNSGWSFSSNAETVEDYYQTTWSNDCAYLASNILSADVPAVMIGPLCVTVVTLMWLQFGREGIMTCRLSMWSSRLNSAAPIISPEASMCRM